LAVAAIPGSVIGQLCKSLVAMFPCILFQTVMPCVQDASLNSIATIREGILEFSGRRAGEMPETLECDRGNIYF